MDEVKLLNYLNGELSEEDVLQVEAWCEASEENRKLIEQLYYTTFIGDRIDMMNALDVEESLKKFKVMIKSKDGCIKKKHHSIRWSRYTVLAAAFLTGIVLTVGFAYLTLNKTSNYIVATTAGQRARFVLPDGSKVWLNSSTRLTYKSSLWNRERQVDLTGEAYFEVAHDDNAPFIVESKNIKTQVLGTKFNVRARAAEDKVIATLLKGSIRVDLPQKEDESFILKPGQILDVNTSTMQAKLTESSSAKDVLLWIQGKLAFNRASGLDIAQSLEQHYDVHFYFKDDKLKNERFTCEFQTDDNIEDILYVLSLTKRLQYKKEGKNIYLSSGN